MWAVHAKNSLINIHGFSPYQLVFGRNPNIPGNSNNKLPALSPETSSKIVATQINSLRAARRAFIKAESSDRIARALRGKVYEGTHRKFCIGDTVYYKRLNNKIWQGPGKVIAQDGAQVLVKSNAGRLVKVHPCKLVLKQDAEKQIGNNNNPTETKEVHHQNNESSSDSDSDKEREEQHQNIVSASNDPAEPINQESTEQIKQSKSNDPTTLERNEEIDQSKQLPQKQSKKIKENTSKSLKKDDKIYYKIADSHDGWVVAKIISRGGKKCSKWGNFWNVQNFQTGCNVGLNLDEVDWIKVDDNAQDVNIVTDQIAWEVLVQNYDNDKSKNQLKAKETEVEKWKKFQVYEEVDKSDYPNHELLSCRWVNESKQVRNEEQYKFRLVARGFQET